MHKVHRRKPSGSGLVLLALLFVSCGGGGGGATIYTLVTTIITAAGGGSMTSADGRVVVTAPPGAVTGDTRIGIRLLQPPQYPPPPPGRAWDGPVYVLTPDGLVFLTPLTMAFTLTPAEVGPPDGSGRVKVRFPWLVDASGTAWELVSGSTTTFADSGGATVLFGVGHFSSVSLTTGPGVKIEGNSDHGHPQPVGPPFTVDLEVESDDPMDTATYTADIPVIPGNPVEGVPAGGSKALFVAPGGLTATESYTHMCALAGAGWRNSTIDITLVGGTTLAVVFRHPIVCGVAAWLTISDDPLYDYGDTPVGASRVRTFTVTNSGVATATGMVGGGLAAPFTFKGGAYPGTGGDCAATLGFTPPTNTCTMVVQYTPLAEVVSTDTITIDHFDGIGAAQATRDVKGTGTGGGVINVPGDYGTIQDAINGAAEGNIILVGQGTYFECIDFIGKDVVVVAGNSDPTLTIIDCGDAGTVVEFTGGESLAAELSGFTVTNGSNPGGDGGGILIWNSSPTLRGNIVTNNDAVNGGGIAVQRNSSPDLINNIVSGNVATTKGGGIWVEGGLLAAAFSAPLFCDNQITGNIAPRGAGMAIEATWPGDTMNANLGGPGCSLIGAGGNSIQTNTATIDGGGLWISGNGADGLITGNSFLGNKAGDNGGGMFVEAGAKPDTIGNEFSANNADDIITGTGDGGGLFITGAGTDPLVQGNSFGVLGDPASANTALNGGHIAVVAGANPTIGGPAPDDPNLLAGGTATSAGGGLFVSGAGTDPLVVNNDISENTAGTNGGGIAVAAGANPAIGGPGATDGNQITANTAAVNGGGIHATGAGTDPAILGNSIGGPGQGNGAVGGGGIAAMAGAKPTIGGPGPTDGNQITANTATGNGGGVFASGAGSDPVIQGNAIGQPGQGNSAVKGGGIAYEAGAAPTIGGPAAANGNSIDSNSASDLGGGIHAASLLSPTMRNNQILNNSATNFGGGVTITGAAAAPLFFDNLVQNNSAGSAGGGLEISGGADPIIGGGGLGNSIQGNTADGGAGIYIQGLGTDPTVDSNAISGNTAESDGGGILVITGPKPLIADNSIHSNIANNAGGGGNGGGIAVDGAGTDPVIKGNLIGGAGQGNTAAKGGGIHITAGASPTVGGPLVADGNQIEANTATADGGGIYMDAATIPIFRNNVIRDNAAAGFGGGVRITGLGVDPDFYQNTLEDNSAGVAGGGFAISFDADPIIGDVGLANNIENNSAGAGGGIYVEAPGTDPSIGSNIILSNAANVDGGGIHVVGGANPVISGNTINLNVADVDANSTGSGGGLFVSGVGTDPLVVDNTFISNSAWLGGGIHVEAGASPSLGLVGMPNTLTTNSATAGGGLFITGVATAPFVLASTINGNTSDSDGGGIFVGDGADPAIGGTAVGEGNTIEGNTAWSGGGGAYFTGSGTNPLFYGNTVTSNTVTGAFITAGGGGIYIADDAGPKIGGPLIGQGNIISLNSAWFGGGFFILGGTGALVELNTISSNSAGDTGGAFHIIHSGIEIKDNLISLSGGAGAIYVKGVGVSPLIHENDIWDNTVSFGALYIEGLASPFVYSNWFSNNDAIAVNVSSGEALSAGGVPWPHFDKPPCTEPNNTYTDTVFKDVIFGDGSDACP